MEPASHDLSIQDFLWASECQNSTLAFGVLAMERLFSGWRADFQSFEPLPVIGGQRDAIPSFLGIFENFPSIKTLEVVLDGRDPNTAGLAEIFEPTGDPNDFYLEGGRQLTLEWLALVLDEAEKQRGFQHKQKVSLKVLSNGPVSEGLERRRDCRFGQCDFKEKGDGEDQRNTESEWTTDSGSDDE